VFPGQYYDQETGLHQNGLRTYDPSTGRYLTADPIGFAGDDLNLYAYVWNNPVNFFDLYGLKGIRPSNPWNAYQRRNPGRSSAENAQNYNQGKLNNLVPDGNKDPLSNLPDTSGQRDLGCPFGSPSCYYEILCDWECFGRYQCSAGDPRIIYGAKLRPRGECTKLRCYWRYQ